MRKRGFYIRENDPNPGPKSRTDYIKEHHLEIGTDIRDQFSNTVIPSKHMREKWAKEILNEEIERRKKQKEDKLIKTRELEAQEGKAKKSRKKADLQAVQEGDQIIKAHDKRMREQV